MRVVVLLGVWALFFAIMQRDAERHRATRRRSALKARARPNQART